MLKLFYVLFWLTLMAAGGLAATLELDAQQSRISVAVATSVHDFTGTVEVFQNSISFDQRDGQPRKADVSFDFKDLKTGSKGRDRDMLKWLSRAANPKAHFHLTGWKQEGTNSIALGDLTLHGVTQSVQMPTAIKREEDKIEISGMAKLDYRDFKLPVIREMLMFSVDPHMVVTFQLKGVLVDKK